MPYDPTKDYLTEADTTYLEALHGRFLADRLGQVGPNSLAGHLIGKLLAVAEERGIPWTSVLAGQLPVSIEVARRMFDLTPQDEAAIEYSREQAATYIADMSDRMKQDVRGAITRALETHQPPKDLALDLFRRVGEANADWRRIALTEAALAQTNGYLCAQAEGTLLVGDSSAEACEWCHAHIHQRVFQMLDEPPTPNSEGNLEGKDSWGFIWPGKTNIGRSKYSKKADGSNREVHELWHPCIPAHPHCRCRWRKFIPSFEEIRPGTNLVQQKGSLEL